MKSEKSIEYKEPLTILYECDGSACAHCDGICTHTTDIHHAKNFKLAEHNNTMRAEISQFTPNIYQKEALRTASNKDNTYTLLHEGIMGLNGEAGECADILKKYLFQGHGLDRDHLAEELGDVAWYLAVSAYAIGYDLDDILKNNIKKLIARYPGGFDKERSVNR